MKPVKIAMAARYHRLNGRADPAERLDAEVGQAGRPASAGGS